ILGISKGVLRVFSSDFPLLGAPPIPVICSIILTSDFPLLEAEVALILATPTPKPKVEFHPTSIPHTNKCKAIANKVQEIADIDHSQCMKIAKVKK
ncbi:hypothetical protein L208DRAFT_1268056, partial [Tricholoma matsutake]